MNETPFDFLAFDGQVVSGFADNIDRQTKAPQNKELRFALVTPGGSPDEAYRAMRLLQCRYEKITLLIPERCKSAGTLIALGAHALAFGSRGELGPLDIQLVKRDEIAGQESGATVISAMNALHAQAFELFQHFFLEVTKRSGGNITAKLATHIAGDVTKGIYEAIFRQIDPHHVGETQRAMLIARAYGTRLACVAQNVDDDSINRLIMSYPSHGFVIDQSEASEIFQHVRSMTEFETALLGATLQENNCRFGVVTQEVIDDITTQMQQAAATAAEAHHEDGQDIETGADNTEPLVAPNDGGVADPQGPGAD